VRFEKDLQLSTKGIVKCAGVPYLHSSAIPLGNVDFFTEEDNGQMNMFNNECEGMCGV
jgi:hypothetical protein